MADSLSELRGQIDAIDAQLIQLLVERARLTARVGQVKEAEGLPLYAPEREAALLARRREQAAEAGLAPELIEDLLRRVMRDSYASQEGSFSATGDAGRPVVIVGGAGQLGRLFASFFERSGYPVRILEVEDWPEAAGRVAGAGLVLVAVPIDRTLEVIERLPPLPPDCVLADLTSVKRAPLSAMLAAHAGPVVGLHPMFGPDVRSLAKQVVVVCEGREPGACRWLLDQLALWGAVLRKEAPEGHDRAMELIQAMRHFTTLIYGAFLARQQADLDELQRLSSPIYRLELAMVGRLFAQSPDLYADIILSASGLPALLEAYRETLDGLLTLVREGSREAIIERFDTVADYFGELAPALLRESGALLRTAHDARDPGDSP
ncbi:MAG: bifunctional chorismate mutase/prephenate dehydrogenase [Deltaproteobacteria bacterium]|nr:bifunctional chorismate mutase/prephenate dehydrogenase [Deltaproteobacteria bacterium]